MLLLASALLAVQTPKRTPPSDISDVMYIEEILNDRCQGNPNAAQRACDLRDGLLIKLSDRGWCWGHSGQTEADKDWEPCPAQKPGN